MSTFPLPWVCLVASVALTCLPAPAAHGRSSAQEGLAARAQGVLRKYCIECHGGEKPLKGELKVLDYGQLVDGRKLVLPGNADGSRLISRIRDGSMPPIDPGVPEEDVQALCKWINKGAYPFGCGDDYVLGHIAANLERLVSRDRLHYRYFSLNHLLEFPAARQQMDLQRQALQQALGYLSRNGRVITLLPIDPGSTVFRVDLRDLGWSQRPFKQVNSKPKADIQSKRTLYDLILAEYPYGLLPEDSELFQQVARMFLRPAEQLRPVAYLRADWFIGLAANPDFTDDFRLFFGKPPDKKGQKPPKGLVVVQAPPQGRFMDPLDARTVRCYAPANLEFEVKFWTIDAKTNKPRDKFVLGDQMEILVDPSRNIYLELVSTLPKGEILILEMSDKPIRAKQPKSIVDTITLEGEDLGTQHFTLYAGDKKFPPGELLRAEGAPDRVVHPFYALTNGKLDPSADPGVIIKKTITITTVKAAPPVKKEVKRRPQKGNRRGPEQDMAVLKK